MDVKLYKQLPGTLYSAVVMELFERLAYYGMFLVLGIYLMEHLGIRADVYGVLLGLFTGALYFFPPFVGALADRFGYRPAFLIAFATLFAGYAVLGSFTSFPLICVALGLIALGGSIIKPTVSGTVTRTTEEGARRSVGFGLYYMMINAGGLLGPVIAAQVRNRTEFRYVFWASAAACALMLVQALVAYREPVTAEQKASGKRLGQVFAEVLLVLRNGRFVLLLVIFSGFWGMMNILFGFMPQLVETFVKLQPVEASIASALPFTRTFGHWLNPEVFVSLDAALIVLLQAVIAFLTRRWRTVSAMLVGTAIATASWMLPASSRTVGMVALGIAVWSVGEMICSARFFQYCGTVAPADRVAVYLGYSFLSIFLGNLYSGPWGGFLYQHYISGPMQKGAQPSFAVFFGGVMLMGVLSAVGLTLYARFVAGRDEQGAAAGADAVVHRSTSQESGAGG